MVTQVAAGLAHCLAVAQDGSLLSWGWNSAGADGGAWGVWVGGSCLASSGRCLAAPHARSTFRAQRVGADACTAAPPPVGICTAAPPCLAYSRTSCCCVGVLTLAAAGLGPRRWLCWAGSLAPVCSPPL